MWILARFWKFWARHCQLAAYYGDLAEFGLVWAWVSQFVAYYVDVATCSQLWAFQASYCCFDGCGNNSADLGFPCQLGHTCRIWVLRCQLAAYYVDHLISLGPFSAHS